MSCRAIGRSDPAYPGWRDRRSHHVDPLPKGCDGKGQNLKMHHQFDIAPGLAQTVYEVADPAKPVEFPALNYAAAAKRLISAIRRG